MHRFYFRIKKYGTSQTASSVLPELIQLKTGADREINEGDRGCDIALYSNGYSPVLAAPSSCTAKQMGLPVVSERRIYVQVCAVTGDDELVLVDLTPCGPPSTSENSSIQQPRLE